MLTSGVEDDLEVEMEGRNLVDPSEIVCSLKLDTVENLETKHRLSHYYI